MRKLFTLTIGLLLFAAGAAQLQAQGRPQFRPAVFVTGPESLVNRIDRKALAAAGQKDAAVMFSARTTKDGKLTDAHTYRGTPESEKLAAEVLKKLADAKVAPAIYDHQPVETIFYGTVVFALEGMGPQVRIFLNQDAGEFTKGTDFIGPQPVIGGDSGFTGLHYPPSATAAAAQVGLSLKVDEKGVPQDVHVLLEDPPQLGFGAAADADFKGVKFIPAFRDGDVDACQTTLVAYYVKP
jgi:hypothetical protein